MGRVLTLAVAAALLAGGCTDDGRPAAEPATATATTPPPQAAAGAPAEPLPGEPLLRYEWLLLEYTLPGRRPVRVPDVGPARYTFNIVGATLKVKACNSMEAPVTVGDAVLRLGRSVSTLKGCPLAEAAIDTAFSRVITRPRVTWTASDGQLRLRGQDGTTLRFEAVGGEYPGGRARTLTSGTNDGWRHRLYAQPAGYGVKVGVTARDPAGRPVNGAAVGVDSNVGVTRDRDRFGVVSSPLGDARYLLGLAPPVTVRVVYRPGGGPAVTVGTYDVPGTAFEAFGFVVTRNPPGSTAAAYAGDGRVLARWTRP